MGFFFALGLSFWTNYLTRSQTELEETRKLLEKWAKANIKVL